MPLKINDAFGFENSDRAMPEGSDEGSSPKSKIETETGTPPCLRWARGLSYLLEDSEGVALFKQFLNSEETSYFLEFWFACSGIKQVPRDDDAKIKSLIKLIAKRYIKGEGGEQQVELEVDTRRAILNKIRRKDFDQNIFDAAQKEVEDYITGNLYQGFLKSDIYLQFLQQGGENKSGLRSLSTSNSSSGAQSVRPLSMLLPTVHEDEELQIASNAATEPVPAPLTSKNLLATSKQRLEYSRRSSMNTAFPRRPPHPYYTSFVCNSTQDSELQSLSSDAHTDDTRSLTDTATSQDRSHSHISKRRLARQHKAIHQQAKQNKDILVDRSVQPFIPRTERSIKDPNLAESNPPKFFRILADKLQVIVNEQAREDRILRALTSANDSLSESIDRSTHSGVGGGAAANQLTALFTSATDATEDMESVLDAHISKWDSSAKHTPLRSPGRYSPRAKSPTDMLGGRVGHHHLSSRSGIPIGRHWEPTSGMPLPSFLAGTNSGGGPHSSTSAAVPHQQYPASSSSGVPPGNFRATPLGMSAYTSNAINRVYHHHPHLQGASSGGPPPPPPGMTAHYYENHSHKFGKRVGPHELSDSGVGDLYDSNEQSTTVHSGHSGVHDGSGGGGSNSSGRAYRGGGGAGPSSAGPGPSSGSLALRHHHQQLQHHHQHTPTSAAATTGHHVHSSSRQDFSHSSAHHHHRPSQQQTGPAGVSSMSLSGSSSHQNHHYSSAAAADQQHHTRSISLSGGGAAAVTAPASRSSVPTSMSVSGPSAAPTSSDSRVAEWILQTACQPPAAAAAANETSSGPSSSRAAFSRRSSSKPPISSAGPAGPSNAAFLGPAGPGPGGLFPYSSKQGKSDKSSGSVGGGNPFSLSASHCPVPPSAPGSGALTQTMLAAATAHVGAQVTHPHITPSSYAASSALPHHHHTASLDSINTSSNAAAVIRSLNLSSNQISSYESRDPRGTAGVAMSNLSTNSGTKGRSTTSAAAPNSSMSSHSSSRLTTGHSRPLPPIPPLSGGQHPHVSSSHHHTSHQQHSQSSHFPSSSSHHNQPSSGAHTSADPSSDVGEETVVGYFFCGESIPYRTVIPGRNITLRQFKEALTSRKGYFRYFFQQPSNEFSSNGSVKAEVSDDNQILPLSDGKILAWVEKAD